MTDPAQSPRTDQICGDLIQFPPAQCSRPPGHGGEHQTAEIPAPLSAVAARMVRESDALIAERDALRDQREEYAQRGRHLRVALLICIGTSAAGIVAVVAAVYAALMTAVPV